jgi:hypothetical protein
VVKVAGVPVAHGMTPFVSDLSLENFELGFWHPFGSHGRESPEDIINRKRSETEKMDGRCGHFNIAGQNRSMSGTANCRLRSRPLAAKAPAHL